MSIAATSKDAHASTLVVMLHAYTGKAGNLDGLATLVSEQWPNAHRYIPELPLGLLSTANPNNIVMRLLREIDRLVEEAARNDVPIEHIVLIGHSISGLLARKLYVISCGETGEAPFEPEYRTGYTAETLVPARAWAPLVSRIVLLAGINRGWRISHHLSIGTAMQFTVGSVLGHLIGLTNRSLLIFTCRRGAEFITNLRIQWLYMQRASAFAPGAAQNKVITVQLLGSRDDTVAPEDNVDLVSGGQFIYLDVPYSGHADVIDVRHPVYGSGRTSAFCLALTGTPSQLDAAQVVPADERFDAPDQKVLHVLFVIHGIRDVGYWTHKVARRVKHQVSGNMSQWATETSSYGYFPMLEFLLPWYRRQKVEWLMDQYTEAIARYPNARFSFVGHSNGTFLLAKALELYPACRFDHVVFAGSVVRKTYEWNRYLRAQPARVKAVLNLVADSDAVVAIFPKLLQDLRMQELGSAGHDGFTSNEPQVMQRFVKGGHGAAIAEEYWEAIAKFVVTGQVDPLLIQQKLEHRGLARLFGPFPRNLLAWTIIIALVALIWVGLDKLIRSFGLAAGSQDLIRGITLTLYILLLWRVLTRA